MFLEQTIQLNQWIATLQEPQRFFVYMGIVCGLPLLYINKKLEDKGE